MQIITIQHDMLLNHTHRNRESTVCAENNRRLQTDLDTHGLLGKMEMYFLGIINSQKYVCRDSLK